MGQGGRVTQPKYPGREGSRPYISRGEPIVGPTHVPPDPYDALREARGEDPWEDVLAERELQEQLADRINDYAPAVHPLFRVGVPFQTPTEEK